jgi:N-acetylglucosamine-6-phosphate deacetylase
MLTYATVQAYAAAGAKSVTHLFNAMSQMGNREPGVVGAALGTGALSAGLIADGIHVHPEMMRIALSAKSGPGEVFLVSDAMAVAGTSETSFELDGRKILRSDGRLTLEDGTLAGADLDLLTAVRVLVDQVDIPLADALRAATKTPAELIAGEPFNLLARSKDELCPHLQGPSLPRSIDRNRIKQTACCSKSVLIRWKVPGLLYVVGPGVSNSAPHCLKAD